MYQGYLILIFIYVATRTNHSLMFCLVPLSRNWLCKIFYTYFGAFFQSHQGTSQYCNIQNNHYLVVNDSPSTIFQSSFTCTFQCYTSPEHYHCQSISTPSSHSITLTRTLSSCTEHYRIWTEHLQTIVFCRALSNDSVLSKPDSVLCKPESVLVQLDRVLAW